MNDIEITPSGNCLVIKSHINKNLFDNIDSNKLQIININTDNIDEKDLKIINNYFKTNKKPRLQVESWQIPFLPEVEKFLLWNYNEEAINLLKNNTVRKLTFWHEQKSKIKTDLTKLLVFKNTLEDLCFIHGGNYINLEITLNELKNIKTLSLDGFKIDFNLIKNDTLKYFHNGGSKTADWTSAANFKNITHCEIWANHKIESIDFLKELINLEYLELNQCPKITYFPNLEHLKKLKKILLNNNKRLNNLEELKKLKNIKCNLFGDSYEREWIYNY